MLKTIHFIAIISLFIFLGSCTKDADVKLPQVESKLVIISFISPQDTIVKVAVTRSQPLYNNSNSGQYTDITDATVQISNGTTTQTLTYSATYKYYYISTSAFPIITGGTYSLTASTPDGKNVNSSTTIPSLNSSLTYSTEFANDPNNPGKYYLDAEWTDVPGTVDYYRLAYYTKYVYVGDIDTSYYAGHQENVSDKNYDGGTFLKDFEVYQDSSSTYFSEGELFLMHASSEYYLYHNKLEDAASSGGPFSEPVQMYSNITGGYGIFAGYNSYKLTVSF